MTQYNQSLGIESNSLSENPGAYGPLNSFTAILPWEITRRSIRSTRGHEGNGDRTHVQHDCDGARMAEKEVKIFRSSDLQKSGNRACWRLILLLQIPQQLLNRHHFTIGDACEVLTKSRRDMCRQSTMTLSQSGYSAGMKPGVVLVL